MAVQSKFFAQMGVYKSTDFVFFLSEFFPPSPVENESNRFSWHLNVLKPTASRCVLTLNSQFSP